MRKYSPRVRRLLRQAQNTARQNKRAAAEQLYRQLTEEEPQVAQAWVGLARVVTDPEEQHAALKRALALEPENHEAQKALARLNGAPPPPPPAKAEPEPEPEPELEEEEERPVPPEEQDAESGLPPFEVEKADEPRDWAATETAAERFEVVEDPQPKDEPVDLSRLDEPSEAPAPAGGLRCYRCGKPINSKNSRLTPVGYMCTTCIREAEDVFFTAQPIHYLIAAAVAFPLGAIIAYLMSNFLGGFFGFFIVIFLGPAAGTLVARIVFRAIGRRRGRYIPYVVGAAVALPAVLLALFFLLVFGALFTGGLLAFYAFLATSAAFYQLR